MPNRRKGISRIPSAAELLEARSRCRVACDMKTLRRLLSYCSGQPWGDDCSIWQGHHNRVIGGSHGHCTFQGKSWYTHRLFYHILREDVTGKSLLHKCPVDNDGRCVNVDHLMFGTQADNCADRVAFGKSNKGERNSTTKLKFTDVQEIRKLAAEGVPKTILAKMYNVHTQNIWHIVYNHTWVQ